MCIRFTNFITISCVELSLWLDNKESACNAGDPGSISGSGRFLGKGNGYSLQYSYLENLVARGVWQAVIHGVEKSQTRLNTHACTHTSFSYSFRTKFLQYDLELQYLTFFIFFIFPNYFYLTFFKFLLENSTNLFSFWGEISFLKSGRDPK